MPLTLHKGSSTPWPSRPPRSHRSGIFRTTPIPVNRYNYPVRNTPAPASFSIPLDVQGRRCAPPHRGRETPMNDIDELVTTLRRLREAIDLTSPILGGSDITGIGVTQA